MTLLGGGQQRVLRHVLGRVAGRAVATGVGFGIGLALIIGEGDGLVVQMLAGAVHGLGSASSSAPFCTSLSRLISQTRDAGSQQAWGPGWWARWRRNRWLPPRRPRHPAGAGRRSCRVRDCRGQVAPRKGGGERAMADPAKTSPCRKVAAGEPRWPRARFDYGFCRRTHRTCSRGALAAPRGLPVRKGLGGSGRGDGPDLRAGDETRYRAGLRG